MTTSLQTIQPNEYEVIRHQAESLVKTGFLPPAIKTAEQALAIILTGRELGIPAMAALNTINVIQGKPTVSPQLMLALIERSGQLKDIEILTGEDYVQVTMWRKGRTEHTERFGRAEAQAMNLAGKDNYKKQALVMYKWRAVAACARTVFPDVILGLYTPEEMGAEVSVTDDGEMTVERLQTPAIDVRESAKGRIGQLMRAHNEEAGEKVWTKQTISEWLEGNYNVKDIDELDEETLIDFELRLRAIIAEDLAIMHENEEVAND
jgi:hypothetical protein